MCVKTKYYCYYCSRDLGFYSKARECKKMKNVLTTTDGDELCWMWKVHVIQTIEDVCDACIKKLPELVADPSLWKPRRPAVIQEPKGRAY